MEEKNPWISIWTKPRATIAQIVAVNPNRSIWWLAAISGFCSLMSVFQSISLGSSVNVLPILILAIIIAPLWGWVSFNIGSLFFTWVGKWFKGQGNFSEVRAVYAWSCVPNLLNIPLWLLMVILFGHQLFENYPESHLFTDSQLIFLFGFSAVKLVTGIWSLVILLNGLAEVQKFSILKAIANVVVAGLIMCVVFTVVWGLIAYAVGGVATSTLTVLKSF